jgi:uncharacterized protein
MVAAGGKSGAIAVLLPDSRRLQLQHGPIDLVIEAIGSSADVRQAYQQARAAFDPLLADLVLELPRLRAATGAEPYGVVARRMVAAVAPFAPEFITPMAAVAGSVADHILAAMRVGTRLERAYVNNGGDIAIHLAEGTFRIRICDNPETGEAGGLVEIGPGDGIGGIATSGWRGRSHSLGIADAVTVLAKSAAEADAAATMIANKVDLPRSGKVTRVPARDLSHDSDLGDRLVTTGVAPLDRDEVEEALSSGERAAYGYRERGLIRAAYLSLSGERRTVDAAPNHNNSREIIHA